MAPPTVQLGNCVKVVDVKTTRDQFPHSKDLSHREVLNDYPGSFRIAMY